MPLETGSFVTDLQQTNPPGTDKKKQGDDHLRLIKACLRGTFPNGSRAQYFPRSRITTANGAIAATDMQAIIAADATSGAQSLSLPTLTSADDGFIVTVIKSDVSANTVTVTGTVNGISGFTLTRQYEAGIFIWSGAAWFGLRERPFIVTGDLQDALITTVKLAALSVSTANLIDVAVTTAKLADLSVATAKLIDASVTNPKLAGPRMTMPVLTSGTAQTYTTPANCKSIRVRAVAAGAGGAGTSGTGTAGGDTSFNAVVAKGGSPGTVNGTGGLGGTGGTGTAAFRCDGGDGCPGNFVAGGGSSQYGGNGGSSFFGGAGHGGSTAPGAGKTNTGGGGGGAGNGSNSEGAGGGAGEYFELLIQNPAATYLYTIGPAGPGGSGNGAAGGSGVIIVEEYY